MAGREPQAAQQLLVQEHFLRQLLWGGGKKSGSLLGKLGNGDEVKTSSMSKYVDKGENVEFIRFSEIGKSAYAQNRAMDTNVSKLNKIKEGDGVKLKGSYYIKGDKGLFYEIHNSGILQNLSPRSVAHDIATSNANVVYLKAKGSK